jgi:hypothetical protein
MYESKLTKQHYISYNSYDMRQEGHPNESDVLPAEDAPMLNTWVSYDRLLKCHDFWSGKMLSKSRSAWQRMCVIENEVEGRLNLNVRNLVMQFLQPELPEKHERQIHGMEDHLTQVLASYQVPETNSKHQPVFSDLSHLSHLIMDFFRDQFFDVSVISK